MSTEEKELVQFGKSNSVVSKVGVEVHTLDELYRFAKVLASSSFLPKQYQNKTMEMKIYDVMAALQLGMEIGLSPMTAIQSIAVVNGNPTVWGDVQLGLVQASKDLEYINEYYEGELEKDNLVAVCVLKRKGHDERQERFSIADAKRAGLWTKDGSWKTHPKRMLRYKARSFCLRDNFSDTLKGIHSTEEMEGEIITMESFGDKRNATFQAVIPHKEEPIKSDPEMVAIFKQKIDGFFNQSTFYVDIMEVQRNAKKTLNKEDYKKISEHAIERFKLLKEQNELEPIYEEVI